MFYIVILIFFKLLVQSLPLSYVKKEKKSALLPVLPRLAWECIFIKEATSCPVLEIVEELVLQRLV